MLMLQLFRAAVDLTKQHVIPKKFLEGLLYASLMVY